jgi:hypothetical protein
MFQAFVFTSSRRTYQETALRGLLQLLDTTNMNFVMMIYWPLKEGGCASACVHLL